MELAKLTKAELMLQCEQQGITNYKSKSKDALIKLLEPQAIEKSIINKTIAKSSDNPNPSISVENMCGLEYLKTLDPNSIDLILTDPPYIISKSSGLDKHYNNVKYNEANDINEVKTEDEWTNYKLQNAIEDDLSLIHI
jgi:DNA modification methylase